nr:hypothetical protein [Escherichia coli]
MAKPLITLNGLKIVIMLGMLVIILCGIRFAAEIIVPFILALFIAVIYQLVFVGVRHGVGISFISMIIKDNFVFLVRPCSSQFALVRCTV